MSLKSDKPMIVKDYFVIERDSNGIEITFDSKECKQRMVIRASGNYIIVDPDEARVLLKMLMEVMEAINKKLSDNAEHE